MPSSRELDLNVQGSSSTQLEMQIGTTGGHELEMDIQETSSTPLTLAVGSTGGHDIEMQVFTGGEAPASNAEAWAVGERHGVPVSSDDPTYHNSAKWHAEQAAGSETTAVQAKNTAVDAKDTAVSAKNAAETAMSHYPKIQSGTWWVWDTTTGDWVDTTVNATGQRGGPGTGSFSSKAVTIPLADWTLTSGLYQYTYTDSDITADTEVTCDFGDDIRSALVGDLIFTPGTGTVVFKTDELPLGAVHVVLHLALEMQTASGQSF